jgi:hypothetical protein
MLLPAAETQALALPPPLPLSPALTVLGATRRRSLLLLLLLLPLPPLLLLLLLLLPGTNGTLTTSP